MQIYLDIFHVAWDYGSTLGVVYGVDACVVVLSEGGKQNAGAHMPCPRCGRDTMKDNT